MAYKIQFAHSFELIDIVLASKEPPCKTWILSSKITDDEDQEYSARRILTEIQTRENYFLVLNINPLLDRGNESFFDIEHTENDLMFPSIFSLKFSRTCNLVLINGDTPEEKEAITTSLLFEKISRAHKDYFIYTFSDSPSMIEFFGSAYALNLRYKYGLILESTTTTLHSHCNREIFAQKCENIVNGRNLRATAVFGPQMFRYRHNADGSLAYGGGTYYEMLRESSERLNFTFTIRKASNNGGSGLKGKKGTWNGALGDVLYWKADLSVNAALSFSRYSVVDPSVTVSWVSRIFYIRKPPLKTSWGAMFSPLTGRVWALTGVITILIASVYHLSILAKFKRHHGRALVETCTVVLALLIEQSHPKVSKKKWINSVGRFIVFMWCVFALVLGTGYRSKLVSFLAFLQGEPVPRTHSELVNSNRTFYFRYYGGIAYEYMMKSDSQIHKQILKRAILVNTSYDCIVYAGMFENSACLDYDFNANYAVLTNGSLGGEDVFIRANDPDIPLLMVYCYRKGSPLTDTLDNYIQRYLSSGLFRFWLDTDWRHGKSEGKAWLESQKNSPLTKQIKNILKDLAPGPKSLTMDSLFGVVLIICLGVSASSIIYLAEISSCVRSVYKRRRDSLFVDRRKSIFQP